MFIINISKYTKRSVQDNMSRFAHHKTRTVILLKSFKTFLTLNLFIFVLFLF